LDPVNLLRAKELYQLQPSSASQDLATMLGGERPSQGGSQQKKFFNSLLSNKPTNMSSLRALSATIGLIHAHMDAALIINKRPLKHDPQLTAPQQGDSNATIALKAFMLSFYQLRSFVDWLVTLLHEFREERVGMANIAPGISKSLHSFVRSNGGFAFLPSGKMFAEESAGKSDLFADRPASVDLSAHRKPSGNARPPVSPARQKQRPALCRDYCIKYKDTTAKGVCRTFNNHAKGCSRGATCAYEHKCAACGEAHSLFAERAKHPDASLR
jgi:hypothetical protein